VLLSAFGPTAYKFPYYIKNTILLIGFEAMFALLISVVIAHFRHNVISSDSSCIPNMTINLLLNLNMLTVDDNPEHHHYV
jgi:hypothetical protein